MIRVLYVDDEEMLLDVCQSFLQSNGDILVETVVSAQDALRILSTIPFDAIVSDYQMPGMNGIDLLKEIRSQGETIPFILFTGKGREEVVIEALNNGADFYLQKGGSPSAQFRELEHKIKEAVRRSRAESALQLNESRLKNAQAIGGIGSWEYDLDVNGANFWGTQESYNIFGIQRPADGKVPESAVWNCIVERETTRDELLGLMKGTGDYDTEYHINPADGGPARMVRAKADIIRDTDGTAVKIIGVIMDITERKRAEERLIRLNKELKAIKECNKALIRAKSEQELVDSICRIVCEVAGFRMAWIGMAENDERKTVRPVAKSGHVRDVMERILVTWDDRDTGKGAMGTAIRTGKTIMLTNAPQNAQMSPWKEYFAELGFNSLIAIPLMDSAGAFGVIGIYIDEPEGFDDEEVELLEEMAGDLAYGIISLRAKANQAKAEEALDKSRQLYSKLMAAIPDFVIVTDMNADIILANEIAIKTSGYRQEEIIGRKLFEFIAPEDLPKAFKNTELMMKGTLGPAIYRLIMKDGTRVTIEANGDVVRDSSGVPTGLVFVCRDMTERHHLESKLYEANRKLKVLDSITRHDTLNKLAVLSGYLSLVKKGHPDERALEMFAKMEGTVASLIEQLNLTREYQNIGMERPEWQSVHTACERGFSQAEACDVHIEIDLDGLEILADPLLDKIFYNLMDNSLNHGETVRKVSVSSEITDGSAKIIYLDDGIGIYPENKEQLFLEGHGRNHGMGLFLSREILGITGIDIKETGSPGKGVRFEIIVPKGSFRKNT